MENVSMMKILVVDDIEDNIDLLLDVLGDLFDLSVAMDGKSALEIVEQDPPDLILLDIMMPGMDGYEVCQRLKADKQTRDIPIIFLTAMTDINDETKGLEMGAVDYLTKPISPPIVQARVRTQLERKKQKDKLQEAYAIIEAQKNRMETELNAGRNIQMSMVPQTFPPFPDRQEFSIHALLKPAREVGGDFYDFFFIDKNHLCLCVGDVSGKGVPAALFMAVTRTLLRARSGDSFSTAELTTRVNQELLAQNRQAMFVTLFIGILDIDQGCLTYTNAGHNPSYLMKAGEEPSLLKTRHGIPLGIFQCDYEQDTVCLAGEDLLFMYTDGATDARDESRNMFGDQRLADLIRMNKNARVKALVENIAQEISHFEQTAEQYDDITLMALRYTPLGAN